MKRSVTQSGFAALEAVLILVIVAILGFTGWFVWHSKQAADKSLNNTANSSASSALLKTKITNFAECKKAAGSQILTTVPPACIINGRTYSYKPAVYVSHATSAAVTSTTLSKSPVELQTAVTSYLKQHISGCVNAQGQPLNEAGGVTDPASRYVENAAILAPLCGSAQLYAYFDGNWHYVGRTQGWYNCDVLQKYKVPASLVHTGEANQATQCYDSKVGELATYTD